MTESISICICSYRRPSLALTLESLARQRAPQGVSLEVVVVDNDCTESARSVTEAVAARMPWPVQYQVEPNKGLSSARNHCLAFARGDWLALIDDDETAEPDWLANLYAVARRCEADAVIGAVRPSFEFAPPGWLVASGFYERTPSATGARLEHGEGLTGNALLRAAFLKAQDLSFDECFNTTGSEDSDFFRRFLERGGIMVGCREAVVSEKVPSERMTADYVRRRSLQIGETYARITHRRRGPLALAYGLVRAAANITAAAGLWCAMRLMRGQARSRYDLAFMRNVGKFRYLFGYRPIEPYK